jgi:hypothetical protein
VNVPEKSWTTIIAAAGKSPLGLAALALLVTGALVMWLAPRAAGTDFTIALVGSLLLLVIALGLAMLAAVRSAPNPEYVLKTERLQTHGPYEYDVFLSAPMAALSEHDYIEQRDFALEVASVLERDCGLARVFYAGRNIAAKPEFDAAEDSVLTDFSAISSSEFFVLLYPRRTASSVLFEAGVALALEKRCIYLVRDSKHLPFLMRQADKAFDNIKTYEYDDLNDLGRILASDSTFRFAAAVSVEAG